MASVTLNLPADLMETLAEVLQAAEPERWIERTDPNSPVLARYRLINHIGEEIEAGAASVTIT